MVDVSTAAMESSSASPASTVSSGAPMVTSSVSYEPSTTSTTEAYPTTTAAPDNMYKEMPYSSMVAGGYASMGCGYGYKKDSKGYCSPEDWVSVIRAYFFGIVTDA
jgi:hypothetical protein